MTNLTCALPIVAIIAAGISATRTERETPRTVVSKDGTTIAYETSGTGPAVILVNGALATRTAGSALARLLAPHLTVYTYDRRGRGESGDTKPYAVEREIEDIAALIDVAGGSAFVFGNSSGACLALEAAASLGAKVTRLAIYEAPYDEGPGAADKWRQFRSQFDTLMAADRHEDAVVLFLKFVGTPEHAVAEMKASPGWPGMVALAPTIAYDNAVLGRDRTIPVERAAKVKAAATLVMDGGGNVKTMPFMSRTADQLGSAIPNAQRRTVEGQGHQVSPPVLAPILVEFFRK